MNNPIDEVLTYYKNQIQLQQDEIDSLKNKIEDLTRKNREQHSKNELLMYENMNIKQLYGSKFDVANRDNSPDSDRFIYQDIGKVNNTEDILKDEILKNSFDFYKNVYNKFGPKTRTPDNFHKYINDKKYEKANLKEIKAIMDEINSKLFYQKKTITKNKKV